MVANGVLTERVARAGLNNTVVDFRASWDGGKDNGVYFAGSSDNSIAYLLGIEAMLSMPGWFATLFANGSAVRSAADFNRTVTDSTIAINLTVGISSGETFFDSDAVAAFYWDYYEYAGGLDTLVADVATSMTVAFRSFLGAAPVPGRAVSQQSYVHVRWGFAVLAVVVVVVATALFLVLAIYWTRRSETEPWKSSALALLFHCLDENVRAQFDAIGGMDEKKRQAKGVKVQLDESDENRTLLRS
ncbi:hypothetical protein DL769_005181 [Monosporascus sp. CRB-8-3]|nr:hypothetical protein DL769_005181 [Monosporascus sp. CRB-8-3]